MLQHSPASADAAPCRGRPLPWWCSGCCCGGCCPSGESTPGGTIVVQHGRRRAGCTSGTGSCCRSALAQDMPDVDVELLTSEGSQAEHRAGGRRARPTSPSRPPTPSTSTARTGSRARTGCGAAPGCTTTTSSCRARRLHGASRPTDLRGKRVAVGPQRLGRAPGRGPAAGGGGPRPRRTSRRWPAGIDSTPALLEDGEHRRLLLVGRSAHRRRCTSSRRRSTSAWCRSATCWTSCTSRAARSALLPGGRDARRRLPATHRTAARADARGRQSAGHHGPRGPRLTEALTRTVIDSRDQHRRRGARGAAGGPADGDLHGSAAAARGRAAATTARSSPDGQRPDSGARLAARDASTVTRRPCGSWCAYAIEPPPAASRAREMDRPRPDPLTFWCRLLRQKRSPMRASSSSVRPGPPSATTIVAVVARSRRP